MRIEGHTDNISTETAQFLSNWELSTSRATYVLKHLISTSQISPKRLSAVGYGEYRPVASNSTREGRGLSRRGDIVILSTTAQAFGRKAMPETGEASDVGQSAGSGEAEPVAQTSSLPDDG